MGKAGFSFFITMKTWKYNSLSVYTDDLSFSVPLAFHINASANPAGAI
jgi:hypothetical protein